MNNETGWNPKQRDESLSKAIGAAWDLITADSELRRARGVLSVHELRVIIETTADIVANAITQSKP